MLNKVTTPHPTKGINRHEKSSTEQAVFATRSDGKIVCSQAVSTGWGRAIRLPKVSHLESVADAVE